MNYKIKLEKTQDKLSNDNNEFFRLGLIIDDQKYQTLAIKTNNDNYNDFYYLNTVFQEMADYFERRIKMEK